AADLDPRAHLPDRLQQELQGPDHDAARHLRQLRPRSYRQVIARLRFAAGRLLQAVPIVLGIVMLNFLLVHLAPGDVATVLAGEAGGAPPEYIEKLRS